jgi:hypothetical protein
LHSIRAIIAFFLACYCGPNPWIPGRCCNPGRDSRAATAFPVLIVFIWLDEFRDSTAFPGLRFPGIPFPGAFLPGRKFGKKLAFVAVIWGVLIYVAPAAEGSREDRRLLLDSNPRESVDARMIVWSESVGVWVLVWSNVCPRLCSTVCDAQIFDCQRLTFRSSNFFICLESSLSASLCWNICVCMYVCMYVRTYT